MTGTVCINVLNLKILVYNYMCPLLTPSITAPAKKDEHSICISIQVFWGGGGGAVSIVFTCMFMRMLLQVKSGDRNQ